MVEDSTAVDFMGDSMMGTIVDSMAGFLLALAQDFGRDITGATTHIIGDFR